jgi:DNA-binding MarR family transcriptional regulator
VADPDFTSEERQVLGVLMQRDRRLEDQTVDAMARDLGMEPADVARVLDGLEAQGVVQNETDATLREEVWIANNEAAERLGPPPEDAA